MAPKKERNSSAKLLPKHERYLDAFGKFLFLTPQHLRRLVGASLNERTLRWDLLKLTNAGYLNRVRNSKDDEYTYFPSKIRERSPMTLVHTNEITWAQILLAESAEQNGLDVMVCERRASRIKFSVLIPNGDGVMRRRACAPDFFSTHQTRTRSSGHYFWEITNAKPGQHWKKENDVIQKCEMYNAYFDSGEFVTRLQKEFQLAAHNFRVIITFPTEARARNFVEIFKQRGVAFPGRYWVTWRDAYRANMYGSIFLSPKDDSLHSFCD